MGEKLREFFKKHTLVLVAGIVALLCFPVALFTLYNSIVPVFTSYPQVIDAKEYTSGVAVAQKDQLEQSFIAKGKRIDGVSIKVDALTENSKGALHVQLLDGNKSEAGYGDINFSDITSPGYIDIKLNHTVNSTADQKYFLKITLQNAEPGTQVTLAAVQDSKYAGDTLQVNGSAQTADIVFRQVQVPSFKVHLAYWAGFVLVVCFLVFVYYILFVKKVKIETAFLIFGFIIAMFYMFLMTPYSTYDEPAHVDTAYRYSNVLMGLGYSTDSGGILKRAEDNMNGLVAWAPGLYTYKTVVTKFFSLAHDTSLVEVTGRAVGEAPYLYFPDALGITVARILHLGQIPLLYMGRLFNLLAFIALTYFAIKKMPFGKIALFTVAMLPMTLHQAATFSYDVLLNGLAFFFTAYCLYAAYSEQELKVKDIVLLAASGALLAPCKIIYVLICFLCLLIPRSRFSIAKKYYLTRGTILGLCLVMFAAFSLPAALSSVTDTNRTAAFANTDAYSFSYILHNPFGFFSILCNSMKLMSSGFVQSVIAGIYMVDVPNNIIVGFIILLILSAIKQDDEKQYLRTKSKLWMLVIILGVIMLLELVGFTWTRNTATIIEGVQGRYLLPVLPLCVLLIRNSNLVLHKKLDRPIIYSVCVLQLFTILHAFTVYIS